MERSIERSTELVSGQAIVFVGGTLVIPLKYFRFFGWSRICFIFEDTFFRDDVMDENSELAHRRRT